MFKPKFTITPEINNRIAEIEKHKTLVDQANILPELEIQLRFRATVESVHSSTSIEGNPLNEKQVENILHGNIITAPDYAIREVLNYKKAIDWLNKKELGRLVSTRQILHLHKVLMAELLPKEKIGVWRPGQIYIVDEINGKEVIQYMGPEADDVPKLVSSFLKWIEGQNMEQLYHPVLLAGLIHYIFVSIHPFSDGNGRTTRLLTHHYLKLTNYDFRQSLSLDVYYLQHRQEYYEALSQSNTFNGRMEADLTEFIDFFTKGFLHSVESLSRYIKAGKISDDTGKPLRLGQEELQILDYVFEFGAITISEAVEILQATKRTTQRRLTSLVENEILKTDGKGPATKYVLISKSS